MKLDWKLIFLLSLVGVAMAFLSVFGMTGRLESVYWLVIFVFYGIIIVKRTPGEYFLHAFLVSTLNGVWIGLIHASFFSIYMMNNPLMKATSQHMPFHTHPRVVMVMMGPIIGAASGFLAGLIAFIAGKTMKKSPPVQAA